MTQRYRPPLETVATGRAYSLSAVKQAVLAAALAAGLLGGDAVLTWAESLPVHPISDRVVAAAAYWREATFSVGLTKPADLWREQFRRFQDSR